MGKRSRALSGARGPGEANHDGAAAARGQACPLPRWLPPHAGTCPLRARCAHKGGFSSEESQACERVHTTVYSLKLPISGSVYNLAPYGGSPKSTGSLLKRGGERRREKELTRFLCLSADLARTSLKKKKEVGRGKEDSGNTKVDRKSILVWKWSRNSRHVSL